MKWLDGIRQSAGLGGSGRPGQVRRSSVYCPLTASWIGRTTELEIRGTRTFYDLEDVGDVVAEAADFNDAATAGGWSLPRQLLGAVTTCECCEAYYLGEDGAPEAMPVLGEIDRKALLEKLGLNEAP